MSLTTLERETLHSEILRLTILMVISSIIVIGFVFLFFAYPEQFAFIFSKEDSWQPLAFVGLITLYFFIMRFFLKRAVKKEHNFSTWGRFLAAFIETSIPTVVIYLIAGIHTPMYVLLSPAVLYYFLFIILSSLSLDLRLCYFTGLVAATEYGILAYYFFHYTDLSHLEPFLIIPENFISRSFVLFISGVATAFVTSQIKRQLLNSFKAAEERDRVASVFGRHVSPEVVNMLMGQSTPIVSESKFVRVMFLDIRNFTTFSENKKPEEVVHYLNLLFSTIIEVVNSHHGIVNKFLGDGLLAMFGAPISSANDVHNALQAAEQILKAVDKEVKQGIIPVTKIGIGLHCGMVVTGNIGAPQRQEYTIIGDVVNLAARIEQLNKDYDSELLISEEVYLELADKKGELLGAVVVKGRQNPVNIYRVS